MLSTSILEKFHEDRIVSAAAIAAGSLSVDANAAPMGASLKAPGNSVENAALSWRCGKRNPASWGTFGNGCLKQKRRWGKG